MNLKYATMIDGFCEVYEWTRTRVYLLIWRRYCIAYCFALYNGQLAHLSILYVLASSVGGAYLILSIVYSTQLIMYTHAFFY